MVELVHVSLFIIGDVTVETKAMVVHHSSEIIDPMIMLLKRKHSSSCVMLIVINFLNFLPPVKPRNTGKQ